ncbi:MAG: PqqD family protein, partial [Cetobacterium sp.]|uniref:PqqD family protein n=1 Tax=Cetobacterium sp. TaxID=2071632 RepID=UPI003EE74BDC
RKVDNRLFLMTTKECYEINEVAKDIFEILNEKTSIEDLILKLERIYENLNKNEIIQFTETLLEKGVIKQC